MEEKFIASEEHARLQCTSCSFIFYQNSKPTASGLIVQGNKILLGKRAHEPEKDKWDIPGGFLEAGEHPEDGLRRELMEEVGIKVRVERLGGIFMDEYGPEKVPTLNIYYLVSPLSEDVIAGSDLKEVKWFTKDEIPYDEIAFSNGKMMIEAWLKGEV